MYIIIVGAGRIGFNLAQKLIHDKHTVTIIEKDKTVTWIWDPEGIRRLKGRGLEWHFERNFSNRGMDKSGLLSNKRCRSQSGRR